MQLLQPIYLIALTALAVPIVIHLWNIRKGRTLRVGSIKLLTESSAQHAVSLRIQQWPLLLLRCLLLVVLVLILVQPLLKNSASGKVRGWILIPPTDFNRALSIYKPTIDSLTKLNYQLRQFSPGFNEYKETRQATQTDTSKTQPSFWDLYQDATIAAGDTKKFIITSNTLSKYRGPRPQMASGDHWLLIADNDTTGRQMEMAYLTGQDSVRYVLTSGSEYHASRMQQTISLNKVPADIKVDINAGNLSISPDGDGVKKVRVDTAVTRINIISDNDAVDGGFVLAALEAIRDYTGRRMQVARNGEQGHYNWLFLLSDKKLTTAITADNIFTYAEGADTANTSWIPGTNTSLFRMVFSSHGEDQQQTVWTSAKGDPVLLRNNDSGVNVYTFTSRFKPAYTDMVWNGELPQMLLKLLFPPINPASTTGVVLNQSQLPTTSTKSASETTIGSENWNTNTDKYLWLIAFLLFFAERMVSFRNPVLLKGK